MCEQRRKQCERSEKGEQIQHTFVGRTPAQALGYSAQEANNGEAVFHVEDRITLAPSPLMGTGG